MTTVDVPLPTSVRAVAFGPAGMTPLTPRRAEKPRGHLAKNYQRAKTLRVLTLVHALNHLGVEAVEILRTPARNETLINKH